MKINSPLIITPRLMAGCQIGNSFISIGYSKRAGCENRIRYQYYIDVGNKEYSGDDIQSGNGGGSLQEGLETLLCFLSAAAEAYWYKMSFPSSSPENLENFPSWVNEWAYQNSDELAMLQCEVQETAGLIEE
jgi:hypothetical protein